jgi:hypothetical protein
MSKPTWGDEVSEALGIIFFFFCFTIVFILYYYFLDGISQDLFYFYFNNNNKYNKNIDEIPPTTIVGPDSNGVKIVTEYYIDEDGKKFKVGSYSPLSLFPP